MEACATSRFGEPEECVLVRVALRATGWVSISGMCEWCSCLVGRGADDDLLILKCILCGLSWVAPVELLDTLFCIVEVFCGVPDFVVFW